MARNTSYTGSIDLISGVRPKNGGAFPLIDAADVQTREDGTRLDGELERFDESVSQLKDDLGNLFVTDAYFNYFMFGELAKVEMNWDFTRGETEALLCDNPDAPEFTVYGTPRFFESGVSACAYRSKDYLDLDISFLKGKSWEMDIWSADYDLTTEKITSNDIPISLLAEGADSPCWIVYASSDLGDNGYALHQYAMNKFGGYKRETEYSVLNRRFRFVRSAENGALRCLLMRIDADGNEEITIDRTITTDVEPDTLRLCNDSTLTKGCMLPISALRIGYEEVPKE